MRWGSPLGQWSGTEARSTVVLRGATEWEVLVMTATMVCILWFGRRSGAVVVLEGECRHATLLVACRTRVGGPVHPVVVDEVAGAPARGPHATGQVVVGVLGPLLLGALGCLHPADAPGEGISDEADVDHAIRIFDDLSKSSIRLFAPEQIFAEIGSTLAVASSSTRNRIQKDAARAGIEEFITLSIETTPSRDLALDAFDFAEQFACSAYDALYLVLARRRAIAFINADRKLQERVGHFPNVIWVADYVSVTDRNDD